MNQNLRDQINSLINESGIHFTPDEHSNLEVTDFGLGNFQQVGMTLHTYVNTSRCCSKELFLLPHQTCPEHLHPTIGANLGKEETFRCRFGKVSLFVEGKQTPTPSVKPPLNGSEYYSVYHEIILNPGDQFTLEPDTKHWFKAHHAGAVISEFSTHSDDDSDIFTDPRIKRSSFI